MVKVRKSWKRALASTLTLVMLLASVYTTPVYAEETVSGGDAATVSGNSVSDNNANDSNVNTEDNANNGTTDLGTTTNFVFDAATDSVITTLATKAVVPAGKYGTEGYFTLSGTVTRGNSSTYSAELGKSQSGEMTFTVCGNADATFTVTSTGSKNVSDFVLVDGSGNKIIPKGATEAIVTVTGTSPTTEISYTGLAAGKYSIYAPADGTNTGRGFRLLYAEVDDIPVSVTKEYTFDAATDSVITTLATKAAVPAGKYGTEDYFTLSGTVTRGNSSTYSAELGKSQSGEMTFTVYGNAEATFTVTSTGSKNVSDFVLVDGSGNKIVPKGATEAIVTVAGTSPTTEISYTGLTAGKYSIYAPADGTNTGRGFRLLYASVTDTTGGSRPERADWATVEAPVLVSAEQLSSKKNTIEVKVTGNVGYDGADILTVTMIDASGKELESKNVSKDGTEYTLTFNPKESGTYTFSVVASREGEADKAAAETKSADFVLYLEAPYVSSVTNMGGGDVSVEWNAVAEADKYIVTVDGTDIEMETTMLNATIVGLTIGQKYTIKVVAVRGDELSEAGSIAVNVVDAVQRKWSFTAYGESTNQENNGYEGNANDGSVTVYSESGKGKIVPASTDGLAFYYTPINPKTENFTLTATVDVDSWVISNGQEGFGLMVADAVGPNGDATPFWNNSYQNIATKTEYYYDGEGVTTDSSASKISMKLGLGTIAKTGVTPADVADIKLGLTAMPKAFVSESSTLESSCGRLGAGTYNIIGNYTGVEPTGTQKDLLTTFRLQIQRNNTGYFLRYLDMDGNVISEKKYYDLERNALTQIDEDNIYVGFFASRNARITVSDIELTTIHPEDDAPAEQREIQYVYPINTIESATFSNSADYEMVYYGNADGQLIITDADGKEVINTAYTALDEKGKSVKERKNVTLKPGKNEFSVTFVPDSEYRPGEYKEMSSYETVTFKHVVEYKTVVNQHIYVSPNGKSTAAGTREYPMDIYSAVKVAAPGQKIIIMEGTYNLTSTVKVERGIDGTAEEMIYMIADPEASSRPVFDFNGACAGMVLAGDYWYFQGFDVTRSADAQKGIQVSGNNNILDNLRTYKNGNSGIQISRYKGTDEWEDWPANNLVLNCTSYLNADKGYEDADGFAAKLTIADGNVFDGCIAAYNADDGWDLFAKVQTGSIGAVTIKNSLAFKNGYVVDENGKEVNAGNGNGFKMGGDSMPGAHVLENSIAFANKAKGIDSNSCPDIKVYNCTTFDNESHNVAFYTKTAVNTAYVAEGILSYKVSNAVNEQVKLVGNQVNENVYNPTNYYFNDGKSTNGTVEVDSTWFKNLDTAAAITGITRNADGTINMNGYLELTDKAATNAGARMTGTASPEIKVPTAQVETVKVDLKASVEALATILKDVVEAVKDTTGCKDASELVDYIVEKAILMAKNNKVKVTEKTTAVVEVKVQVPVEVNGKKEYVDATAENFPKEGVDILLPYPEGAGKGDNFSISHLVVLGCNGQVPGTMEDCEYVATQDGLLVHTMSASPFVITWDDKTEGGNGVVVVEPDDDDDDDDDDTVVENTSNQQTATKQTSTKKPSASGGKLVASAEKTETTKTETSKTEKPAVTTEKADTEPAKPQEEVKVDDKADSTVVVEATAAAATGAPVWGILIALAAVAVVGLAVGVFVLRRKEDTLE